MHSADSKYMDPSTIALQGLQQVDAELDAAANAIANAGSAPSSTSPNVADLGEDMVSLTSAQTSYEANLATLQTADQMEQALIDVTA